MPRILLADDCKVWRHLVQRAMARHKLPLDIAFVTNGAEVIECLTARKSDGGDGLPSLVIVDLNMPLASGRDVLEIVLKDPVLSTIPFVVMSTTSFDSEVEQCRKLGCVEFITKPNNVAGFVDVMSNLTARWLAKSTVN